MGIAGYLRCVADRSDAGDPVHIRAPGMMPMPVLRNSLLGADEFLPAVVAEAPMHAF